MREKNIGKAANKWMILVVVVLMSFMSCLDSSIVNVALPVMREKMGVEMASLEWVVTGYLMMICGSILIFGRLGDVLGKVRVFQLGVVLFTLSSLACALCRNLEALVVCRLLQGVGAAAYMANNQGIITQTFQKGERGKALGLLGSSVALGTMMGPPLGGFIMSRFSWNAIFLINVPLGLFAFIAGMRALPAEESRRERFDVLGAGLFFAFVALAVGGVSFAQKSGFRNPVIVACLALSLFCLIAFIARERKTAFPLLDLSVFRNRSFSFALCCAFVSFVCLSASIIILPFYLENAREFAVSATGLVMMLSPLIIAFASPLSGSASDRVGPELPSFAGLACMGAGFILMALLRIDSPLPALLGFLAVGALGNGLFQPSNNTIIMSSVPRDKLGVAGSVNSLVRNVGQVCGVTLSTTLLYGLMSAASGRPVTDYPEGHGDVFIRAMAVIYLILGAICLLGAVLTFMRLLKRARSRSGARAI